MTTEAELLWITPRRTSSHGGGVGHWLLRVALGGSFTFAAASAIDVSNTSADPYAVEDGAGEVEAEIEAILRQHGRSPTATVVLGYRIF